MNNQGAVIISYPGPPKYTGGTIQYNGTTTIHTFTSSERMEMIEWQQHYAVIPRRINGRWYWRTTVYRRRVDNRWVYGDVFDALR